MSMINEFVEEIKAKINHKKEYHKNFYEKLGQTLNDNDLHKATQFAFDDCMEFINELAEKYRDVPDTNVGKNLSENLIEIIKFGIEASNINDDYTTGLRNGMRYCLSLIDGKKPEFESCKQGWITCEEALPDEEGSYLVTFNDGYVSSAPFYDEDWELWGDSGEPVAWQPLPKPYKGE